jgi:hypothetical protein
MPVYSHRKRKSAKKSTRRSRRRLSRRIKTRRGGGGGGNMTVESLKDSFKTLLKESTNPEYFAPDLTAKNFFDLYNKNNEITSIIEKHNNSEFVARDDLLQKLIVKLNKDDAMNNQVFINFLSDTFDLRGK